jgi:hypothetical protein
MVQGYKSAGLLPVEDVLVKIRAGHTTLSAYGQVVKLTSIRLRTFTKGVVCIECKKEGSFFSIDTQTSSKGKYHLNLWHKSKTGAWILMTSDHIHPKSKGGADKDLENRQPMCRPCNARKADKVGGEVEDEFLSTVRKLLQLEKRNMSLSKRLKNPVSLWRFNTNKGYFNKLLREYTSIPGAEKHWQHLEL